MIPIATMQRQPLRQSFWATLTIQMKLSQPTQMIQSLLFLVAVKPYRQVMQLLHPELLLATSTCKSSFESLLEIHI